MASIFQMLSMVLAHQFGRQQLARTLEPEQITDARDHVLQYDQVMSTKLVIPYACGLMVVHRGHSRATGGSAIDLACGPGHYTLCLARYLGFEQVVGIDLSPAMVAQATQNAVEQNMGEQVQFSARDVTALDDVGADQFDLASFTNAAHHMPNLDTVARVVREMDRVTKPDGLVMLMDLVRLRTSRLTDRYVNTLGHDYVERGLPSFLEDFRSSMYAAWTVKELRQTIPADTDRWWCHIVPRGLPTVQLILGLPIGRQKVFVRSGMPWHPAQSPVPREMNSEWKMLRLSLRFASRWMIPPGRCL